MKKVISSCSDRMILIAVKITEIGRYARIALTEKSHKIQPSLCDTALILQYESYCMNHAACQRLG